ncbi:MAG: family 1 glycosylhydrolase [Collinsella sp.]
MPARPQYRAARDPLALRDALSLVEKYNGWASRGLISFFEKYCQTVFDRYQDKVKFWLN